MDKKKIGMICGGLIVIFIIVILVSGAMNNTGTTDSNAPKGYVVEIISDCSWSGSIVNGSVTSTYDGTGNQNYTLGDVGIVSCVIQKKSSSGSLTVNIYKDGKLVQTGNTTAEYGVVSVAT